MKPVKDRPISFNSALVKAITEGRKTQTRRVLTKINTFGNVTEVKKHNSLWHMFDKKGQTHKLTDEEMVIDCHFGQPGDRLSVREPWQYALPGHPAKTKNKFVYVAKGDEKPFWIDIDGTLRNRWLPSWIMPREANRKILQITEIGIELLNEISDQDLLNAGIHEFHHQERKPGTWWSADPGDPTHFDGTPRGAFKKRWNSVGGNWTDNPLVWVISFKCHAQSA